MSQVIDSLSSGCTDSILCCYVNASSKIQVARITNVPEWYFERVVFPGQKLMFEAPLTAQLEIHCGMMASAILSDTIPCDRLRIEEDEVPPPFGVTTAPEAKPTNQAAPETEPVNTEEIQSSETAEEVQGSSDDLTQRPKVRSFVPTASMAS